MPLEGERRRRRVNEIKLTAGLQHPHILPLFDSGQAGDESCEFLYYVTAYVDGGSLREWLDKKRQLSVEDALAITQSVASALDYAHRRDVIHRDIKLDGPRGRSYNRP